MGKKISDETIEQCKKMYLEDNLSCEKISKIVGISPCTIVRRLRKLGVQIDSRPNDAKFEVSEVIDYYKNGMPIWQIAKKFKSSEERISKVIKNEGIKVFRNGVKPSINIHIFDTIDTEEKAYWLGFIWADGCIITINEEKKNYAFELGISVKDIDHLYKFCTFAKIPESKIQIKKYSDNSFNKNGYMCRVQVSSEHLWKTLNSYGYVPNKTYDEKFPDESIFKDSTLIRHFIRGFFDGDGWVYEDARGYLMSGMCGQYDFLAKIITYLPEKLQTVNILDAPNTEVINIIKWGCNPAKILVNYLYRDATIYLQRKYDIIAPYISNNISKSGNIGESPTFEDNTEISSEIAKGSEPSLSVGLE